MEIIEKHKGRTTKNAKVTGGIDKDAALAFVMDHFGENKDSLFGWLVLEDFDGNLDVALYTD